MTCRKPFRNTLYQYAWTSLQKEEWAAEYYQRKRKEGKSHTMALRALANQWVRVIHALWKKGEAYDRGLPSGAEGLLPARRVNRHRGESWTHSEGRGSGWHGTSLPWPYL